MAARDDVLGRLIEVAAGDERILAVTEGGSAVVGETDEYSDLDLVVVCSDAGHPELLAESEEVASRLGPLLSSFTAEHVGEPWMRICLFGPPPLHVDLKLVAVAELSSRVEDGVVVWEREPGLVAAACTAPASWPVIEPQWVEDRFWVWVHYLAAKIGRGELFDCIEGLAYLRGVVLGPMLAVLNGRRPQGVRRIEMYAGPAVEELERTIGGPTREACTDAVRASVALYRRLRDEQQAPGLVRRSAAEAASLAYLGEVEGAGR